MPLRTICKHLNPAIGVSLVPAAFVFLSGFILSSSVTSADVVDDVVVTVPVSCNITDELDEAHTATINPGQYQSEIGTTNFKVFCNDNSGYAIYAIGYSNEEYGNTKMLATINSELSPTNNINTGTNTSGANSSWAMKLVPVTTASSGTEQPYTPTIESDTNGSFANYHVIPEEYTKVATFTSNTDFTIGSSLQSTYQVYIDGTKPAGTYAGKVKYTLVHPATAPAPVTCNPNGTTIGTNTGTDIKCMQDFASLSAAAKTALLGTMTEGTQYTLVDKRDEKSYTIAKLADGKVWMTSNLDLDLDANTTYTNEDTDLGWNTSTNQYDTASWSPIRSTYATAANNIHTWCQGGTWNSGGYCEQNNTPESYDPGNLYWNSETSDYSDWNAYYNSCDYSTSTPSCDESLNPLSTYTSNTGTTEYHLGNYYNWAAAIASNDASVYGAYNETTGEYENLETHQSICPAGWTLPYTTYNDGLGQSEGDFANLWSEYGWTDNDGFSDISTAWSAPLYFAPAGSFGGYFGAVGGNGYFWSSVAAGDGDAHDADFSVDGDAIPADYGGRIAGDSVRCLLR